MRKYTLGDHPEVTLNFYSDAKFFGVGAKFDTENLEEKIKEFNRENDKIIVIGENHIKCSITAPVVMIDKIQLILKNFIGTPIKNIENAEIK